MFEKLKTVWRELVIPAGLLAAIIMGAGMFALPYVFMKAGFLTAILYLIVFTAITATIHVAYGKIITESEPGHRFVGYAKLYGGNVGWFVAALTTFCGIALTLTAYLVLVKGFFGILFSAPYDNYAILIFWIAAFVGVLAGARRVAPFEFVITLAKIFIMGSIFAFGLQSPNMHLQNFPVFSFAYVLLPFGAVLFSLSGREAISSIKSYYDEKKLPVTHFSKALVVGTVVPAICYLLFAVGVFALSGGAVSPDSISGLAGIPRFMFLAIGGLGVISLWTAFVLLALELRGNLEFDFKLPAILDVAIAMTLPLGLYIAGFQNFMQIISFMGAVFTALQAALIIFMWKKMRGKISPLYYLILAIFALGACYEVLASHFNLL